MKTVLKIIGMTCQNCVHHVKEALTAVSGVESADVDLQQGIATISGAATVTDLIAVVGEAGYEARLEE